MNAPTDLARLLPRLEGTVSPEEWQTRVDLAAAYRLVALFRWDDLVFTHITAKIPGTEHFLINPYGLAFEEITASSLLKIDLAGNKLSDSPHPVNPAGFVIHGCIHEARPEANAVLHTHTRAGVAVSAMKKGLLPLSQHSLRVYSELTYHDYEGVALEMDERTRMARDLGKESHAMVLKNHGLLTLGKSVSEAFEYMYYLECACQIQVDALSGGQDTVTFITDETVEKGKQQFNRPNRQSAEKHWPALLRMLDRRGSDYKN